MAKASFHEFINMLEKTWNKSAKAYVVKEHLKLDPNSFRISARIDYKNEKGITARIQAGPVNQIQITFPQKNYSKTIQKVLDYLANPNVHRDEDLEEQRFIGSVVHELYTNAIWKRRNKNGKNRHWKKNAKDRIITRRREKPEFVAEVEVVNTVRVKHRLTGVYVEIVDKEGREVWDMLQEAYHSCALKAHETMNSEEVEASLANLSGIQNFVEIKRESKSLVLIKDIIIPRYELEEIHQLWHSIYVTGELMDM